MPIENIKKMSVFILFFIILVQISGCNENSTEDTGHNFDIILLDGSTIQLSDFRGKIVIMDLWAIWCQPCAAQLIELDILYDTYSRDDLEILSINIDLRESSQDIQDYIDSAKDYDYDFEWIFGNDEGSIWDDYQISGGIPTLYIFDKKGNIYYSAEALHSNSDLAKKIDELL